MRSDAPLNFCGESFRHDRHSPRVSIKNCTADVRAAKGHAYLEVCDTGIGVPAEDLARIFDRFYRVDQVRSRAIEGAGLGLSIVWSICTAHGGSVYAENLAGGGSRFTAELPLAD